MVPVQLTPLSGQPESRAFVFWHVRFQLRVGKVTTLVLQNDTCYLILNTLKNFKLFRTVGF